jgi:flagellar biosynthetic protein FliQ
VTDADVLQIAASALQIATKLAAPALAATLVIGTIISVVQTVTQIQEQTLTFVPKLIGVALVLLFGGHWMIRELVGWVTQLWGSIPTFA